jgi:DNA polymerase-3 subunit gamma/tau
VVTALYRRYRPETFAELIGQAQVTDPLRTALRTDRVGHAYLFSGPRGCGKTTSARILARCLNCAQGPTDAPCGECASCVELARNGGGSLDVVEIDAASHNGVDDARDLRERAAFAPARDRYKIFILDEAHMVTPQGFNALLKLVEEPPEHVKFIFATTEPEKVIGTIRSRTHHYPFRLVPPAQMLDYVQQLSASEGIAVEPGVLPLVVRAGGGSVRDTLSLLDQLMAGSDAATIEYERAVALLGYTHGALLDEVVDALGERDAAEAFRAVDRVIQTGQDPRRFVEDLLERLRDLVVVAATRESASAVLRGIPEDELDRMAAQATRFGAAELSRAADVVNSALTEMTGATSPRLHLELMVARLLVPAADESERGTLARVERLERRIGIEDAGAASSREAHPAARVPAEPVDIRTARTRAEERREATHRTAHEPDELEQPNEPEHPDEPEPRIASEEPSGDSSAGTDAPADPIVAAAVPAGPVSLGQLRDAWPEILEAVKRSTRSAWMVIFASTPRVLTDDVLTLSFANESDVVSFRQPQSSGESVSEQLRGAIHEILGIRVKFLARVDADAAPDPVPAVPTAPPAPVEPSSDVAWNVVSIPGEAADRVDTIAVPDDSEDPGPDPEPPVVVESADVEDAPAAVPDAAAAAVEPDPVDAVAPVEPAVARVGPPARERYGEAVVREILGASFLEEESLATVEPVPPVERPPAPEPED